MSVAPRELPGSAVRVTAHCRHCKADIETDGSNRCPSCGAETLPESRGQARIVNLSAPPVEDVRLPETGGASEVAEPKRPAPAQGTVLIRARREATAWHAARAKLLAVLEHEEAAALARYEAAKADLQQIRRERSAISQDIGLITIEGPTVSSTAAAASGIKRGQCALLKGRWSRGYEACRGPDHEGDDRTAIPHKARGFCDRCYDTPAARSIRESETNGN